MDRSAKSRYLYQTQQKYTTRTAVSPDALAMEVILGEYQEPLYVYNVYNAPHGSVQTGGAISAIFQEPRSIFDRAIIAGDFNLHHVDWDEKTRNPTRQAAKLAD